ncbi:MAG: CPBP family intramembrane metalloprotease [Sandaracinus sp.]|nr:CPBP family intramembrane metalloprotease [Sandaracinus sp.]
MIRPLALGLAILLLVAAYALGLVGIGERFATERDVGGEAIALGALEDPRVLVRTALAEGQAVVFEVCAEDGFGEAWARTGGFEILYAEEARFDVVRAVPFDEVLAQRVQRDAEGIGCVVVADAESLGVSGEYVVALAAGALPETLANVRARARVIAWTPLGGSDRLAVWLALAGALQLVVALALPRKREEDEAPTAEASESSSLAPSRLVLRVVVGVVALIGAMFGLAFVPLGGAQGAVVRGLLIALAEVLVAFFWIAPVVDAVRPPRSAALGLAPPRRAPMVWLLTAPLLGLALVIVGRFVAMAIPSTGVAPIEVFVELPSGRLAVALVAVFVPIAEELFFRGFVFGSLERARGGNLALVATTILFALVHLPQQWGAWGAFASVAFTGLVLTGLRRATGSTLLCALVHLTHNALITLLSI